MAKKQSEYQTKYFDKTMKQIKLAMYQEQAEQFETFCEDHGFKKQTFIKEAIRKYMQEYGASLMTDEEANELSRTRRSSEKEPAN